MIAYDSIFLKLISFLQIFRSQRPYLQIKFVLLQMHLPDAAVMSYEQDGADEVWTIR